MPPSLKLARIPRGCQNHRTSLMAVLEGKQAFTCGGGAPGAGGPPPKPPKKEYFF
jgi:hypothetical protein